MAVPQRDSVSGVISRFLARRVRCVAYALAAALFVLASSVADPALAAPRYGHAAIVERDGATVFERDGRPFFLYGAAFFYERLPRASWDASMDALARIGINTLDLYVPWNWHELSDGDFDFDGRTNPRRDLHEVLRLAAAHDFAIVLRPGPVVRNEWRNGGYPAWLLERPEYAMPRHDLLEGRYPPIATLQNAHSDDAARAWMANATHTYYARRWLERVLRECAPVADRILAVALDDDQGAYIDNQTYPAPHLRAYLAWLRGVVHGVTGDDELTFVNTYQMKVPSSSPVWAMGNWYQSEAYALGEHDLAQLELSFGMLATRPHQPLFASEFQAGWLEGAGDARPRAADPANTELALATMLGDGARGIVNFPAQDTLDPPGWEAPFANAFYAWDAALDLAGTPGARYAPTAAFGAFVGRFNAELAAAPVARDAAIAYFGGSFAPARTTNELIGDAAARLEEAQAACRAAGLSCAVVDPRVADLRPFRVLIAPAPHVGTVPPLEPVVAARLRAFARGGGLIDAGSPTADGLLADLARARRVPVVLGIPNATLARATTGGAARGFLVAANYANAPLAVARASVALAATHRVSLRAFTIPAHRALVEALDANGNVLGVVSNPARDAARAPAGDAAASSPAREAGTPAPAGADAGVPIRNDARLPVAPFEPVAPGTARAYRSDAFADGGLEVVLDNGIVRLVVAPDAGARAFVFEDVATGRNVFSSVGGLRDDVAIEPALSTSDRIARYTHDFPAGTFNRPYDVVVGADGGDARARFSYDAPDVVPAGARFDREIALEPNARSFEVDERFSPDGAADAGVSDAGAQRGVVVTSLVVGDGADAGTRIVLSPATESPDALGYFDPATHELATIAWRAGDVERAAIVRRPDSIVVRLTLSPGKRARMRYGNLSAADEPAARAALEAEDRAAQARPSERRSGA